jgi:hypothetical protein
MSSRLKEEGNKCVFLLVGSKDLGSGRALDIGFGFGVGLAYKTLPFATFLLGCF